MVLTGRMGREVVKQIKNQESFSVICGVDKYDLGEDSYILDILSKEIGDVNNG